MEIFYDFFGKRVEFLRVCPHINIHGVRGWIRLCQISPKPSDTDIIAIQIQSLKQENIMNINLSNYKGPYLLIAISVAWLGLYSIISLFPEWNLIKAITPTATIVALLYWHNEHLWKRPIGKWLVCVPDLNGTYEGEIEHYYDGKESHKKASLRVEQTASTIRVTSIFSKEGESTTQSESKEAFFDKNSKRKLLVYYESEGSHADPSNLSKHEGLVTLNIAEENGKTTLSGRYFTNRIPPTKGKIEVTRKERN